METQQTIDPAVLERLRNSAAFREAEEAERRQRQERRQGLAAQRRAVIAERKEKLSRLDKAHAAATEKVSKCRAALEVAEAEEGEARRRVSMASTDLDRRQRFIEGELREGAPEEIGAFIGELAKLSEGLRRAQPAVIQLPLGAGVWTNADALGEALATLNELRRKAEALQLEPAAEAVTRRLAELGEAAQEALRLARAGPGATPADLENLAQEIRAERERALLEARERRFEREAAERKAMREYQRKLKSGWTPERQRAEEMQEAHRRHAAVLMARLEAGPDDAA